MTKKNALKYYLNEVENAIHHNNINNGFPLNTQDIGNGRYLMSILVSFEMIINGLVGCREHIFIHIY